MQANINANTVKELRDITGVGIMDCKRALAACNGDVEASVAWLRKHGLNNVGQKAGRTTAEGVIVIRNNGTQAVIVELNAETDFVAKNEKFVELAGNIAEAAQYFNGSPEEFKNSELNGQKVSDVITQHVMIMGENINLNRITHVKLTNSGIIANYTHNMVGNDNDIGKIGVLVVIESTADQDILQGLGKQLAMHIAAIKPEALTIEKLDKALVEKEKEIFVEQCSKSGKSPELIEKMIDGRIRKFYEEVVLLEQPFVLDSKNKVRQILENIGREVGHTVKIVEFVRFALGEKVQIKGSVKSNLQSST
ncbi:Elongation factor Ts [Alphaproteobacteria bacterium]